MALAEVRGIQQLQQDKRFSCSPTSACFTDHSFFPSQMGTNKCASQAGMSAYGTRRHLYDPKAQIQPPMDSTTISLQMGTNKGASQVLQHFQLLINVFIIGL